MPAARIRPIFSRCSRQPSTPARRWSIFPTRRATRVPEQYGALIRTLRENVPNIERATISVHCHDDLGLAVANTLAGVLNGARQVEGTINGIGERAGNAALEEVVMAIRTRRDYFGVDTGIDAREFYRTSRLVADMLGMQVPPNKAVVGGNAFSHSSGIHVDGFLKERETYEIMRPEDVGMLESRVVLTARTGRHGLRDRLEKLGYTLSARGTGPGLPAIPGGGRQETGGLRRGPDGHPPRRNSSGARDLPAGVPAHLQRHLGHSDRDRARARRATKSSEGAAIGDGPVDAVCKAISAGHRKHGHARPLRDSRGHQRHRSHGRGHGAARMRRPRESWGAARRRT